MYGGTVRQFRAETDLAMAVLHLSRAQTQQRGRHRGAESSRPSGFQLRSADPARPMSSIPGRRTDNSYSPRKKRKSSRPSTGRPNRGRGALEIAAVERLSGAKCRLVPLGMLEILGEMVRPLMIHVTELVQTI